IQLVKKLIGDAGCDFSPVPPGDRIFVRYDHTAGLLDGGSNCRPIVRRQGAQIDYLDADLRVLLFELQGRLKTFLHQRAVGYSGEACAGFYHLGLAERDEEILARMRRAVVRLTVELLVLQEKHGILATNGCSQQPAS